MDGLKQRSVGGLLVILILGSCAVDSRPPCPQASATFRLQLSASDGPLPDDTVVTVHFGGSEQERYRLGESNSGNEVLCCRKAELTKGTIRPVGCGRRFASDAARPDASFDTLRTHHVGPALHCELWTNGAAEIQVVAQGYAPLEATLEARPAVPEAEDDREMLKGCAALETRDVSLELQLQEGGVR